MRIFLCLSGSYFFYGWWDWRFLFLILFSTIINYIAGKKIFIEKSDRRRKKIFVFSLILNIGLLVYFKYFNFFIDSFVNIASALGMYPSVHTLQIILPLGISFYTFQTLSYTIDIYWKKLKPESDFMVFATYVAFFPKLLAGPIVGAADLLPQFKLNRRITSAHISKGMFLVVLGYFKKIVVANSLAPLVNDAFANPLNYSSLNMTICVVFYAFQIYCDFSGYSDIAIGLAKMMGYNFPKNFNLPYLARNLSDFWKRWHITLSSWLKDYLYIPLGGNRMGDLSTQRNLLVTMLLGGLWHGANMTFVVWGLLHGSFLIIKKILRPASNLLDKFLPKPLFNFFGIIITFVLVNIAWIFFRSPTIEVAFEIIGKIFSFDNMSFSALKPKFQINKSIFVISILFIGEISYFLFSKKIDVILRDNKFIKLSISAFLIWIILLFGTFSNNNFIYFQF